MCNAFSAVPTRTMTLAVITLHLINGKLIFAEYS